MQSDCTTEMCFFCREPIEGKGVQWDEQNNWKENPDGNGLTKIYLHGKCSVDLGMRLIGDGFSLQDRLTTEVVTQLVNSRMRH